MLKSVSYKQEIQIIPYLNILSYQIKICSDRTELKLSNLCESNLLHFKSTTEQYCKQIIEHSIRTHSRSGAARSSRGRCGTSVGGCGRSAFGARDRQVHAEFAHLALLLCQRERQLHGKTKACKIHRYTYDIRIFKSETITKSFEVKFLEIKSDKEITITQKQLIKPYISEWYNDGVASFGRRERRHWVGFAGALGNEVPREVHGLQDLHVARQNALALHCCSRRRRAHRSLHWWRHVPPARPACSRALPRSCHNYTTKIN